MRWANCIALRETDASDFATSHFSEPHRQILFIGGAGFDPRALIYPDILARTAKRRLSALLIKEERPEPADDLVEHATRNLKMIQKLIPESEVVAIEVFSEDLSVTGVRQAARAVASALGNEFTDIVIDQSALSIGVGFPLIKTVLTHEAVTSRDINVHAVVAFMPGIDSAVVSKPVDKVRDVIGFKGKLGLSTHDRAARLWLPQLTPSHGYQLDLLHRAIDPHDTCPILPFPSANPRAGDDLVAEYSEKLTDWQVSDGNLIYAADNNPLDLYRTILRLEAKRGQVFERIGGSSVVLSPAGSKALALGALMAAVERDLPMMYIESLGYEVDWGAISRIPGESAALIHLWLAGEPYPDSGPLS